ncbi:MAG: endoribonuclease MazF [Thermosynechococcaceae cyanobacterium]
MAYVPEQGDAVWIDFNPQMGHEQAGRRPALILSPLSYNRKVRLALLCPITSRVKGYPFEVVIPSGEKVSGVILSDQVKSLEWQKRNVEFVAKLPDEIVAEVMKKLKTLLP